MTHQGMTPEEAEKEIVELGDKVAYFAGMIARHQMVARGFEMDLEETKKRVETLTRFILATRKPKVEPIQPKQPEPKPR